VEDCFKIISEYLVTGLRRLHIVNIHDVGPLESWKIKCLLSHCASTLEDLFIRYQIAYNEELDELHHVLQQPESMPLLKCLALSQLGKLPGSEGFLSWLWERCSQVERLELSELNDLQSLVDSLPIHMPNLNSIRLTQLGLSDENIAVLLSKSHKGWKEVCKEHLKGLWQSTQRILMEHCLTLERLEIHGCKGFTSIWKAQILAASPNLHTFSTLDGGWFEGTSFFHAHSFINQDPHTGELKTWACESSLKTLKVCITGVPMPGFHGVSEWGAVQETNPGQAREIQGHLYDRLARLTHLETLWLAQENRVMDKPDCLEMSLESGLHKLAGLKELKELSIEHLKTRIGVQEVQWMVDQWPKLRTILGLGSQRSEEAKEAMEWLRKYHPEICLSQW